jgi:beta-fructofuranosidase
MFLYAPRSLVDPDLRHDNAHVGHAVSDDLRTWTRLPDAVVPGPAGAFDDHATWTGSVVRAPDGRWHLYYTGVTCTDGVYLQRVCRAISDDCLTWRKDPEPVLSADPRWYALAGENKWADEHWRDPWVFVDPAGNGWHLLVTARARPEQWPDVDLDDLGVIGHGWSADLQRWEARPPLSSPGAGFGHLEVAQIVDVDGCWCLVFSCLLGELGPTRRNAGATGGHWLVTDVDPTGPYDAAAAVALTDDTLYAGRILRGDGAQPVLVAFDNRWTTDSGGTLVDPLDVVLSRAEVLGAPPVVRRPPEGYGTAPTS